GKTMRVRGWEFHQVGHGVKRAEVERLVGEGVLEYVVKVAGNTSYRLSEKGTGLIAVQAQQHEASRVPADSVMSAMDLVVGFDDLKQAIAQSVEARCRTNYLLQGSPACGKSLILEGVRSAVPDAYMAFGSRTSGPGLSEALFTYQPTVLLLDEADKMNNETLAVLLGLMEHGEILETKSRQSRGIVLNTMVLAACNRSDKMPAEFLSRFALHAIFPPYTRQEFLDVCRGFLTRGEQCPVELAGLIGERVFDLGLGDVRKARAIWQLMTAPTQDEVERVVALMLKYGTPPPERRRRRPQAVGRLVGM
ncbi:MAG: AAA family ATPase, partial [Chloroflexota bacterium]